MLRIAFDKDATIPTIRLEGELIEPWVTEFRAFLESQSVFTESRLCVVDLGSVTRVDEPGKTILAEMKTRGAKLSAKGVYMKHLIEGLIK